MTATIVTIFVIVYLGMILGGLPLLQLDRTGIALLGAIALLATGALTLPQASAAIHVPTLLLLFSFMVISAQMRLGGFYAWVTRRVANLSLAPPLLLGALIAVIAALSAVFSNDVVCLAVAPVLADSCRRRGLAPVPFLLALACAANVGSAATLIGNPQNMLIGETLRLSFGGYAALALPPVLLGLAATWGVVVWRVGGRWHTAAAEPPAERREEPPLDPWQTAKGLAVAAALVGLFLAADWPRELAALTGAGLLLLSRKLHSNKMLGLVDWELLVLFIGLFVVNAAMQQTGLAAQLVADLATRGIDLAHPLALFVSTFALSNIVSNVPAVMLLLPLTGDAHAGALLALASTLAGNLLIVGSIANILVVDAAARRGIAIGWQDHARIGVPVTVATLAIAGGWLWLRSG